MNFRWLVASLWNKTHLDLSVPSCFVYLAQSFRSLTYSQYLKTGGLYIKDQSLTSYGKLEHLGTLGMRFLDKIRGFQSPLLSVGFCSASCIVFITCLVSVGIWMYNPWSNSSLYFLYRELKSGDNESLTQSCPGINTWAHTRIPWLQSLYSRAWLRSLGVCRQWGALLGGTWVCLSCGHKAHPPLLPGRGQGGHWVREVSVSSHLGWVTGSHSGQWGRGKEGGLNFPWPFPSLISSLIVSLTIPTVVSDGTSANPLLAASAPWYLCFVEFFYSHGYTFPFAQGFWFPSEVLVSSVLGHNTYLTLTKKALK